MIIAKKISSLRRFTRSFGTTKLLFGNEAREGLKRGVHDLAKCTNVTLGPLVYCNTIISQQKGSNVAIEYETGLPRITKDGVTVAKNISFDLGASLLRRASHNTNLFAGDGTTTSILISSYIVDEGIKLVREGVSPIDMKNGILLAKAKVIEYLEAIKRQALSKQDLYHAAMVSTNYDDWLSKLLSEACFESGLNGVIHIEPNRSYETTLLFTEGVTINRGYASQEFVKDLKSTKIEIANPYILTANLEMDKLKQIVPILDLVKKIHRPLFIVTKDLSNECLSTILYNHVKGIVDVCAITVPGAGQFPKDLIEDISVLTGSYLFDSSDPEKILNCKIEDLGSASKVICSPDETFFVGSGGRQEQIQKRIEQLKEESLKSDKYSQTQISIYKERLSQLNGKMALLLCGGNSEVEIGENYDKIVDALNSLKTAMEKGILPGGGSALLYASRILDFVETNNQDEKLGVEILKKAIRRPLEALARTGEPHGKEIIDTLLTKYDDNETGFNFKTGKYVNMFEDGVVDSFNTVKTTLDDACSVGSLLLTTEVAVVQELTYKPTALKYYAKEPF